MLQITARQIQPYTWTDADGFHSYRQLVGFFLDFARTCIISSEFNAWEQFRQDRGMGRHSGVDTPSPLGTFNYWDAAGGEVLASGGSFVGFGNRLVVKVTDFEGVDWLVGVAHLQQRPKHASGVEWFRGERIERGDFFGMVGMTGVATGPHNHIWVGKAIDFDKAVDEDTGDTLEFGEFWLSPRDDDGVNRRLVDPITFLVDDAALVAPLPPLLAPPSYVDGWNLVQLQRPAEAHMLEFVAHSDGLSNLFVALDGRLQGTPIGSPDFVWDDVFKEFPGATMPAGQIMLTYRK